MPPIICKERSDSGRLRSDGAEARTIEGKWDVFMPRSADPTPMDPFAAETRLRESVPFAKSDPQTGIPLYAQNFVLEPQDAFYSIGTLEYKTLQGDDALPIGTVPGEDWAPPSFRIFGETTNIKFSKETLYQTTVAGGGGGAVNGSAPAGGVGDFANLVNVTSQNGQNDVNGADVLKSKTQFSIPRYYPMQIVSRGWIAALEAINNTLCSHDFIGHAPGEIFMLGIEGGPNYAKSRMELMLHFLAAPNLSNVQIGSFTIPTIKGFDYPWCTYENGQVGNVMVSVPKAVYVERMYDYASWGVLGFS